MYINIYPLFSYKYIFDKYYGGVQSQKNDRYLQSRRIFKLSRKLKTPLGRKHPIKTILSHIYEIIKLSLYPNVFYRCAYCKSISTRLNIVDSKGNIFCTDNCKQGFNYNNQKTNGIN